jgi:hypothetical protein
VASLLRLLIVCLLTLSLPMQGLAAARMMHCADPVPQPSSDGAAAAGARDAGDPHADHHTDHQAAAEAAKADQAGHGGGSNASHHGSACAACCAALGLPPAWPVPDAPREARFAPSPAGASPHSVVPRLPDRPPRPHLA